MSDERVLAGGTVLDVENGELTAADLRIVGGVIQEWLPPGTATAGAEVVDVAGRVLVPGFMDAHLHIESSMLAPAEFARVAVQHGTTAVFVDPHEIANVAGPRGVEFFLQQADALPLDLFVGIPSCVPATHLETAGGAVALHDIDRLLEHARVYGLAEMMNFPGIIHGLGDARARVNIAWEAGKIVDGHAPGLSGPDLHTYVTNGENDGIVRIMSDHECTSQEEALEKHRAGVTIALRYGTASKDLDRILPGLWEATGGDLGGFMLCSDDVSAEELNADGHMDRTVRRARDLLAESAGLDAKAAAIEAIRLATRNVGAYFARFLQTTGHPPLGTLSEGARANVVILDSLESLQVVDVICGGRRQGERPPPANEPAPADLKSSVHLDHRLTADEFVVRVPPGASGARVIVHQPGSLLTGEMTVAVPAADGVVPSDPENDLAVLAVFERHGGPGTRFVGLVHGLGLRRGAVASTVAHDSHNLVLAGVDASDLAAAGEALRECGGGLAVAVDGTVTTLPLRLAGLMSDRSLPEVVGDFEMILAAVRQTGTPLENPFMALSFLSLPVIPNLKITDRGLVDVNRFEFVPLEIQ